MTEAGGTPINMEYHHWSAMNEQIIILQRDLAASQAQLAADKQEIAQLKNLTNKINVV